MILYYLYSSLVSSKPSWHLPCFATVLAVLFVDFLGAESLIGSLDLGAVWTLVHTVSTLTGLTEISVTETQQQYHLMYLCIYSSFMVRFIITILYTLYRRSIHLYSEDNFQSC